MADARYQGWLPGPDLGHPRRNINSLFNSETFNCSRGPANKNGHTWARHSEQESGDGTQEAHEIPPPQ